MIVAGGVYYEQCISPEWNNYYGSGGRAAAALSGFGIKIKLMTFAPSEFREEIEAAFGSYDFRTEFHDSEAIYGFNYLHALSDPTYYSVPSSPSKHVSMTANDPVVLRFGFMEGTAVVHAEYAVYDPQSPQPEFFTANGSVAKHLAYVLNESELAALYRGQELDSAARQLLQQENAEVALIKRGVFGVRLITSGGISASIPAYETTHVFKIGSGDVFSAAFAYHWCVRGMSPMEAASLASKSAAWYCDTRSLPLPEDDLLSGLSPVSGGAPRKIYLAAPFFTLSQRWMVEEVRRVLMDMGATVFSPIHDVGSGEPAYVAPLDLDALHDSAVILTLADGGDIGTIFEAGYAHAYKIKNIVFSERLPDYQLTMLKGTGCRIETDLSTALYHALWASLA